ncbi:MAG: 3'-5' exoribonuclease [Bacteroidetes bacterium]|nr:3'-5' exoribonuclease [Bacteroidota bacterium]
MIDLETLSIRPNAVILTIGAVKFERNTNPVNPKFLDTFYRRIDISWITSYYLGSNVYFLVL